MIDVTPHEVGSLTVTATSINALTEREREEWSALFRDQPDLANPFLDPTWIIAWYRHFADESDHMFLLVRHETTGALVGVAPLFYRRIGFAGLTFARYVRLAGAGGLTPLEIPGVLTAAGFEREVTRSLVTFTLRAKGDWFETSLTPSQGWFEPEWMLDSGQPVTFSEHRHVRACVVLRLEDTWEKTRGRLKRNVKESVRRSQNRLKKDGRDWRINLLTDRALDAAAVDRFLGLHRARSDAPQAGVYHHNAYSDPATQRFVREVLPVLGKQGAATLFELELERRVVASQLVLHAPGCSYVHSSGFDPQIWDFGPVTLLHSKVVQHAIERGDRYVNFSPGPTVSKLRWSEELWSTHDFAYGAGTTLKFRYGLYALATQLRTHNRAVSHFTRNARPAVTTETETGSVSASL
jgi:CelD/BcsL family acetyltransferase involved in cellulose biosynthesis